MVHAWLGRDAPHLRRHGCPSGGAPGHPDAACCGNGGFAVNIVLNLFFVYGLNMSVAGSAIGTSIAQWAMAAVYLVMVSRNARQHRVSLKPDWHGIRAMTKVGSWLMLRTLSLRLAILATVLVVTAQGAVNLAAHQLAMTIFSFLAFALDALAIAAQA